MHKCNNCGTEFDSKFCPECGTEWREKKTCPRCGATVGSSMKFCGDCGFSFEQQQIKAENEKKEATERKKSVERSSTAAFKLYTAFGYIPLGLFMLFAVLLFPFYATPVACMNNAFFDSAYSFGSVYNIGANFPELNATMIALIVIAALVSAVALVAIITRIIPALRDKKIIADFTVSEILTFTSFLVYIVYIIIGIVIFSKVSEIDENSGVIEAGALPKLLITFGAIFFVFSIVAHATVFVMNKRFPKFKTDRIRIRLQKNDDKYARLQEFYNTHDEPIPPEPILTLNADVVAIRNYDKQYATYKHAMRRYDKGKEGEPSKAIVWFGMHKVFVGIVIALLVIGIVLTCVLVPIFTSIFRAETVKRIQLGYTQSQVKEILGNPFKAASTDTIWRYYDSEYTDILEDINENHAAQEKAMMGGGDLFGLIKEESVLQSRLENLTYKYIEVHFDSKENAVGKVKYTVSSILFDNERCDKKIGSKKDGNARLIGSSEIGYYVDSTSEQAEYKQIEYKHNTLEQFEYEVEFSDGSFCRSVLTNYSVDMKLSAGYVSWSDSFGEYTERVETELIGGISKEGRWTNYYRDVEKLNLPEGVISIGDYAFSYCSKLTSIVIPNSVMSIGRNAFSNCSIEMATIPAMAINSVKNSKLKTVVITSGGSIGYGAFRDCYSVTRISILNSVTSIGGMAFSGCSSLTSIEIPDSVTSIEYGAFSGCRSLTSIEIPNSVTSIGNYAFDGCSSLTSIMIPNSVTIIPSFAFYNCSSLTNIEIPNSVTSIWSSAFWGCSSLMSIEMPSSLTNIGDYAFRNCSGLTSLEIPSSVTSIGRWAFSCCSSLTSITIPNSVTSIGNGAFSGCGSLTSIYIPDSVKSVERDAFYDCSRLTIYCEAESKPSGWHDDWNSSNCPVVWDCKNNDE